MSLLLSSRYSRGLPRTVRRCQFNVPSRFEPGLGCKLDRWCRLSNHDHSDPDHGHHRSPSENHHGGQEAPRSKLLASRSNWTRRGVIPKEALFGCHSDLRFSAKYCLSVRRGQYATIEDNRSGHRFAVDTNHRDTLRSARADHVCENTIAFCDPPGCMDFKNLT